MLESVYNNQSTNFSDFGSYPLDNNLELKFPKSSIVVKKTAKKYSYERLSENSRNRQILDMGTKIKLHVCPILPLNLPEPKTTILYLDMSTPICVGKNLKSKITLQYPIEIGIFIEKNNEYELIDCFSCDPLLSRFALYGTPTNGNFCKYVLVDFADDVIDNFCFAKMDVIITNNSDTTAKIGKIVFDASQQNIYYSDDGIFTDPLNMEIETESRAILRHEISTKNCSKSIQIQSDDPKQFVMTEGFS